MTRFRRLAGAGIISIIAGCAPAMMGNRQADEAAIRSLTMDWQRAVAARDLDRIIALHTSDAIVATPGGPAITGTAAIRQSWTGFLQSNPSLSWQPTSITVAASGDIAMEVGTYQLSFDTPSGRTNDRGTYSTHWRKVGNEWRVAGDFVTSAVPMPAMVVFDTSPSEMLGTGGINWQPFAPPGFPAGAQRAVIHGDPTKEADYVLRVRFPDGFRIPQHWHMKAEHVTVLVGEFNLGMGRDPNGAASAHGPGAFLYMPARTPHFGWTRGETILQLHGIGPFVLNLGVPPS